LMGVVQLVPTVALVLAIALLVDLATAEVSPGANDNASGVAVAIALARALDAAPPRHLTVDLVLQGASDASAVGLRRYLRRRKGKLKATNTVVLGIAPCAAGQPRWWLSDGQLVPVRYLSRLRQLCSEIVADEPALHAAPTRGRGATPALSARAASIPAICIGALGTDELAPRSHQKGDTTDGLDPATLDATVEFGLLLVDGIDRFMRTAPRDPERPRRASQDSASRATPAASTQRAQSA
jgi:Peptidase family M28